MNDPKRWLIHGDAPQAAVQLLRAMDVPAPPNVVKHGELTRHLATLASSAGAAPASAIGTWLTLGVVCIGSVGGGILLATGIGPTADPVIPAVVEVSEPYVAPPPPPQNVDEGRQPEPVGNGPTAELPRESQSAKRQKSGARDALAEEEALLARARRLSATAPKPAWALLRAHRDRFPNGQLAAERLFLSIDVLERLGDTNGASKQAEALMRHFPNSVYAKQLENGALRP